MPLILINCSTCKYWEKIQDNPHGNYGYCHRNPPLRIEQLTKELFERSHPPTTKQDGWCGEWIKAN